MKALPARYVLAILGFLGFVTQYTTRQNLSVTIVAMVKEEPHSDSQEKMVACQELMEDHRNSNATQTNASISGEFDWDSQTQGMLLGSFYYGYVITQIPAGIFAEKYGAKWLFGIGTLVNIIFTLLTPVAARWSVWALFSARFIEGLGQGVTYPAMNALLGRWAPKLERSRLSTIIYSGAPVGTSVTLVLSGVLSDSGFLGGWPSAFYIFGLVGCVWLVFWMTLVFESPDTHPRITKEELLYISQDQDQGQSCKGHTPWKSILTSVPVWVLILTHFGQQLGYYTLLIELPIYMSNILHFDLKKNGVLSALPNVVYFIFALVFSVAADKMRASGRYRISTIRKIFNSIAFFSPAAILVVVAFSGCRPILIVALLSLAMGFLGVMHSGFLVTHLDMSPDFAGTLFGLTNTLSNLSGILLPSYVGWIIKDGQTVHNWGIVFFTASAVLTSTGILYNIFGTAELQSWGINQDIMPGKKLSIQIPNPSGDLKTNGKEQNGSYITKL